MTLPSRNESLIDAQRAADASRSRRRWSVAIVALIASILMAIDFGNDLAITCESAAPSRSIGTPENGRLENGKRLPSRGRNFRVYSDLGALIGRNTVHDAVRRSVVEAYEAMEQSRPASRFVYGETGWPSGGPFPPHKTHQNGMAVDFFVPVLDAWGRPFFLPTGVLNKFGYSIEFDAQGRWNEYQIDFNALADHLAALADAAHAHGLRIELVIFEKELRDRLFATTAGKALAKTMPFSRSRPWVRHDEHYHVVFAPL